MLKKVVDTHVTLSYIFVKVIQIGVSNTYFLIETHCCTLLLLNVFNAFRNVRGLNLGTPQKKKSVFNACILF